jgi:type I restriction enzyme S subunit
MSESVNEISSAGWTKVTLGEIAGNISENDYNPKEKGLDHCVGLEHLDPGSLKIRRWLPITPEMSFTRRFSKGQILFGKRRAYQKKVALADFDGICSSDILVIEAKKENFVPELLPFIIQDDRFFEYAVGTSSGSLSPRTKWKFLADYEISLPSIDEQRHIATALWAAEDCIIKGERFIATAEQGKRVLMRELFSRGIGHTEFKETKIGRLPVQWNVKHLQEVANVNPESSDPTLIPNKKFLYVDIESVENGTGVIKSAKEMFGKDAPSRARRIIKENDVIMSQVRPYLKAFAIISERFNDQICSTGFAVLRSKEEINTKFLFNLLFSDLVMNQCNQMMVGSQYPAINDNQVKMLQIPIPPLPEQRQIAGILTRCDETIAAARANVVAAKALKMKMINEMLSQKGE